MACARRIRIREGGSQAADVTVLEEQAGKNYTDILQDIQIPDDVQIVDVVRR